jgi:hypothetical protein
MIPIIAIAVGITEAGEVKTLYAGNDYAAAQAEAMKAGEAGQVIRAEAYKNPVPAWRHDFSYIKDRAKAAEAAKAKAKK